MNAGTGSKKFLKKIISEKLDDKNLHNTMIAGNYPDPDIPADMAWGEMKKLLGDVPVNMQTGKSAQINIGKFFLYAGSGLMIILAISYFLTPKKPQKINTSITYHSEAYTKKDSLPDGSTLFLDTNSNVTISGEPDSEPIIIVNGGAYFEWNQATEHSMHLKLGSLDVLPQQATLYASFDGITGTASLQLESGTVIMENDGTKLHLSAGESITYNEKTKRFGEKQQVNVNIYSYATRIFDFTDTPLKEAAAAIAKTYAVKIVFDNQKLYGCRITTRFDNKTLKEILDVMSYTLKFQYSIDKKNNSVLLAGYGCD